MNGSEYDNLHSEHGDIDSSYQPVAKEDENGEQQEADRLGEGPINQEPINLDLALEIPSSALDLDMSAIIGPASPLSEIQQDEKVQKRASNVLKLSQEHEKLKEELRAMTERLEAAERRQKEYMTRSRGGTRA